MPDTLPTAQDNPLNSFVKEKIKRSETKLNARVIGRYSQSAGSSFGSSITPQVDIQLSGRHSANIQGNTHPIIRAVPISANNRAIGYTRYMDNSIEVTRSSTGRLEITGLQKRGPSMSIIQKSISPKSGNVVPGSTKIISTVMRPLEYSELADVAGGYGSVPYGSFGLFDGNGNLVELQSGGPPSNM